MKDYSIIIEKLMDGITTILEESYDYGYDQGYADALRKNAVEESDKAYQQGLEDAWEAAKKLVLLPSDGGLECETITKIFDSSTHYTVLKDVPAIEAIAKIKEYEEKQDAEIKVGDEVVSKLGKKGVVITDVPSENGYISVWFSTSTHVQLYLIKDLVKTGKHYDQIAEVLAEMRGEE